MRGGCKAANWGLAALVLFGGVGVCVAGGVWSARVWSERAWSAERRLVALGLSAERRSAASG